MSLADTSGYACFEAIYDYEANEGEIDLKIGDQCFVPKPIRDPKGWLEGVNMRTKFQGQFPGTYCKVANINAVPPRPKKKPTPIARPVPKMVINNHTIEKICVVKPIWCILCDDYIWGGGKISLICSGCSLCAHAGCQIIFKKYLCNEVDPAMIKPKSELTKKVDDWMPDEVLEWMVAARLHPYIQLIRQKNIFGRDLKNIDEKFLQELGIPFSLHIKLFQICLDELLKPPPTAEQLAAVISLKENISIQTHEKLHDHTFTTQQVCNICGKYMLGIFRQGILCAVCGMQCHRPCAFSMHSQCPGMLTIARRSSVSEDPSFCCNFNTISIPPVMRKCVEAVEYTGMKEANVYTKVVPYDSFQLLKSALNQSPEAVNMKDEYWRDPGCAAHVLKTFLLELPMPLLPLDYYEPFLNLIRTENERSNLIVDLWNSLPDFNRSHLYYLLNHLQKLTIYSDTNGMTISKIAYVFSFLIMRPHDSEASKFISNLDIQEDVLTYLLHSFDQLAPKTAQSLQTDQEFESGKWLWDHGTRKDVSQRLFGTPDGSFLVRPSETRRGEWTLTVRKEGKDRLVKIITRDGLFGFREDLLKFRSIKELVFHFRDNSLKDYNEKLDIRLSRPCAKPEKLQVKEEDSKKIKMRFEVLSEKLREIKIIEFKVEEHYQQFEDCKILCESQADVVNFIEEQISLAELQFLEASAEDRKDLNVSQALLNKLLDREKKILDELDEQHVALNQEYNRLKAQLTELSTELPLLREEYNELEPQMRTTEPELFHNEKDYEQDIEQEAPFYDHLPTIANQRSTDLDKEFWLFDHLEKRNIQSMLENKPDGTFLVRKSTNYPFVISLVHDNQIKHIPVLRGEQGYGFAEPHNTYATLEALVNHYHNQSLRLHNRNLDTTLRIPYMFLEHTGDEPIYD